jgi:hypothetical protein
MRCPVLIFIHSQTNRFIASHTNPDDEKKGGSHCAVGINRTRSPKRRKCLHNPQSFLYWKRS